MAGAYRQMGKISEAVEAYRELIRISDDRKLVGDAERFLAGLGDNVKKETGMDLDEYLANMKTFEKGVVAMNSGNYDLAIELFNQVLAKDPEHVQTWGNLGLTYACRGARVKALEYLERALGIDPEYEIAMANKIMIEESMKEGEPINFEGECIEYYKEYGGENKRSYLSDITDRLKK